MFIDISVQKRVDLMTRAELPSFDPLLDISRELAEAEGNVIRKVASRTITGCCITVSFEVQ